MANPDRPNGFRPKGEPLRCNRYQAGGTFYRGDLVKLDANGQVVVAAASDATVGVAATSATSGADALVYDHPDQMFIGQADEGQIDAQTDINLNYDFLATAGSSTFSQSRQEVDSSTQATTATLPLKVLDYERRPDNALGTNVDVIFKINNHQLSAGTGTAGT